VGSRHDKKRALLRNGRIIRGFGPVHGGDLGKCGMLARARIAGRMNERDLMIG
jgi:hypothetical protein